MSWLNVAEIRTHQDETEFEACYRNLTSWSYYFCDTPVGFSPSQINLFFSALEIILYAECKRWSFGEGEFADSTLLQLHGKTLFSMAKHRTLCDSPSALPVTECGQTKQVGGPPYSLAVGGHSWKSDGVLIQSITLLFFLFSTLFYLTVLHFGFKINTTDKTWKKERLFFKDVIGVQDSRGKAHVFNCAT